MCSRFSVDLVSISFKLILEDPSARFELFSTLMVSSFVNYINIILKYLKSYLSSSKGLFKFFCEFG